MHPKFKEMYPPGSELRRRKIEQLTKKPHLQNNFYSRGLFWRWRGSWLGWKKPISDSESLFFLAKADFDNKDAIVNQIKGLQLSDSTIMRWIEDISKNISDQLLADLSAALCFSIAVDESTDVTGAAQLCVWLRFLKENSFQEEILCLVSFLAQTRGEDSLDSFLSFFDGQVLQVCVRMAPNISIRCEAKRMGLLVSWKIIFKKREEMAIFIGFHCIVHQESLVSKLRNNEFQDMMQRVARVINFIVSRALNHR